MTEQEIKACECRKNGYSHCKKHLRYHIIFVTKYSNLILENLINRKSQNKLYE